MNFKNIVLTAGLLAASALASAAPITGQIGFAGDVTDTGSELQFTNTIAFATSGTYAGLDGNSVTTSNITYDPFYSVANPLWTFTVGLNTYSFELSSLVDQSVNGFTLFSGEGTLSATGFDDTDGTWKYSAQGLTFSAQSAPSPVSEPATIALLGLGLAGLGIARRKQAKA